ncbi:2-amino-4-oxopentanoate thiolase subunit OrtA [Desulfosporosinus sp. BICA1-9]|uniref:2-amino-4-oxopentanoate thiolase subunit OrtA n=1 Tax=Desulfosporosinus sp. BICA1-9 TaxID=1531958 RepID=UPI0005F21F64|nr:2-amino-4-oxopentanoate thiolase subunit OrtA [Desulfosporosinus sp. BICA1-9]KJS47125.1 MAG: 2-amino-4-ketopentanoate thiolase [Peptococcaceae bacterium BRH_c23]KJS79784.1 MAG: 2-amino-4-ketopentanoate thiolase [Desulfosporosinus sp. BICA1-9]HBW38459.1 2-amino-4-ketopentanoate thiolase [Desulfosporosinus sp.]
MSSDYKSTLEEHGVSGDWVEIWNVIMEPGKRAPQVPEDTQKVPLEMRLRGFLVNEQAKLGEMVSVRTRIGRVVDGKLVSLHPRYNHSFGEPQKVLLDIGQELRTFLKKGRVGDE